jgi:uncharacterized protein YndB with AHSA1/START domain
MEASRKTRITVKALVERPIEAVWRRWTQPEDVMQWNNASPDWHTPRAQNDLRVGGRFNYHMAAKDGSFAFDFEGTYTDVQPHARIAYTLDDDRVVEVTFQPQANGVLVTETFEAESENSVELQQGGWQAILDSFKRHVEAH